MGLPVRRLAGYTLYLSGMPSSHARCRGSGTCLFKLKDFG
jgi:hypothetical protein